MAEEQKKELDQRLIGVLIGVAGLILIILGVLGIVRVTFLGIIGVIVGVIVYFVGVSNKKKWEAVKKDLYPEGEGENQ